jgi:hypothetical protein
MRGVQCATILPCALVLAFVGSVEAGDQALRARLVGDVIDLNTGDTANLGGLSAAWNVSDGEYRVAWFDSRIEGQNDVYAQRVAADGQLLGDNVEIISGPSSQTDTGIAHDSMRNRYLIKWKNQSGDPGSPGFNHSYGALASATGGLIDDVLDISNAGFESTLLYNALSDEYFLEARNFAGGGVAGIYARRVSGDGALIGGNIIIATAGAPAPAGQAAHDTNANRYLATWRDQSAESLKGRLINADGTFFTSAFEISPLFPESSLAATVAFDPMNDRYLVVYSEFCAGRMRGLFVSSTGEPGDSFFYENCSPARVFPFMAWDDVHRVLLLVWLNSDTGKLTAQLLADDGTRLGEPLPLENPGTASALPCVTANGDAGGFLVTWIDHAWQEPQHHDVLAQRVGVCCAADFDCDGDIDTADLLFLLGAWGTSDGDVDGDGDTDTADLLALLASWGDCPP